MTVTLPTPDGAYIELYPKVVEADVPMLISLEVLEQYGIILDFSSRMIKQMGRKWELPMTFKNGDLFIEWNAKVVCFTIAELQRLHLQFFYPYVDKLFNLLKLARSTEATGEAKDLLQQITKSCSTCTYFSTKPF